MIQRTPCIKARAFCAANSYTPTQIENATKDQIQTLLTLTDEEIKEYKYFWMGIKEILLSDARERELQNRLVVFKTDIEAAYPLATNLTDERAKELGTDLMPYLYGEI